MENGVPDGPYLPTGGILLFPRRVLVAGFGSKDHEGRRTRRACRSGLRILDGESRV